jgi:uncharacterized membrane protein YgdD (TMEM256/DUF423 family)
MLAVFDTAARYQMTHALALLAVAWACAHWPQRRALVAAGWLFVAGSLLFCGSLYVLSLSGVRAWGAVTPLGGAAWLAGWGALCWEMLRGRGGSK